MSDLAPPTNADDAFETTHMKVLESLTWRQYGAQYTDTDTKTHTHRRG